jgi:hypothetical protein
MPFVFAVYYSCTGETELITTTTSTPDLTANQTATAYTVGGGLRLWLLFGKSESLHGISTEFLFRTPTLYAVQPHLDNTLEKCNQPTE